MMERRNDGTNFTYEFFVERQSRSFLYFILCLNKSGALQLLGVWVPLQDEVYLAFWYWWERYAVSKHCMKRGLASDHKLILFCLDVNIWLFTGKYLPTVVHILNLLYRKRLAWPDRNVKDNTANFLANRKIDSYKVAIS
jgi:hypothetical protein